MRVLVCGDRKWSDWEMLSSTLDLLHHRLRFNCVIEGEAKGADSMAAEWAKRRGVPVAAYPANWKEHHRAAGPIRNRQMLVEGKPNLVIGFHSNIAESKGTKDMLKRSAKAGVEVKLFPEGQNMDFLK